MAQVGRDYLICFGWFWPLCSELESFLKTISFRGERLAPPTYRFDQNRYQIHLTVDGGLIAVVACNDNVGEHRFARSTNYEAKTSDDKATESRIGGVHRPER